MATTVKKIGRPALNRNLQFFYPRVDDDVVAELRREAQDLQLSLGHYLDGVLSAAHAYTSERTLDVKLLPGGISAGDLRDRTLSLSADDCLRGGTGRSTKVPIRLEPALAQVIKERCNDLRVPGSAYLRAIFREATNLQRAGSAHQLVAQFSIPKTTSPVVGEVMHQQAS